MPSYFLIHILSYKVRPFCQVQVALLRNPFPDCARTMNILQRRFAMPYHALNDNMTNAGKQIARDRKTAARIYQKHVTDNAVRQYHCTALLNPLRLSYFSASVSVAALQRKEKLYDVYGAKTTEQLMLKQWRSR